MKVPTRLWLFVLLFTTLCPTLERYGVRVEGRSIRTRYPGPTPKSERLNALGAILKRHVSKLRSAPRAELVFLVDSSASVGAENFVNELRFVRKLLADFTVSHDRTHVALVTFSSKKKVVREVDHITAPSAENHKCALHNRQLAGARYSGGGTFTLGAMKEAMDILRFAREDSVKAVFLVTDGYSNGGDPRPCAKMLRDGDVTIYTFGIRNGNVRELQDMASTPYDEHCYILDGFEEFEALARRALHEDMHVGPHQLVNATECAGLCPEGDRCCHHEALCTCGTSSGQYACLCPKGHYGSGLRGDCHPCPRGTYQPVEASGDASICVPCPHAHQNSSPGSTSVAQCHCKRGYSADGGTCKVVRCDPLSPPDNGYMVNADCEVVFNAACGFRCNAGYRLIGNSIRVCQHDGTWSGSDLECEKKKCSPLEAPLHGSMSCSSDSFDFDTTCEFECQRGYALIGSRKRTCLSIALWDGLPALCRPVTCPPLVAPANGALSPSHCSETKSSFGEDCSVTCADGFRVSGPDTRHCLGTGTWSEPDDVTVCAGTEPPVIRNCPGDIVVNSEPGYGEAIVDWEMLEAVDKTGASVFLNVAPSVMPPHLFPIGEHEVSYWAEDDWGNTAFCNFTVTVADEEPPFVESCSDPPEAFSDGQSFAYVSWEEPAFWDNSGEDVKLWKSHSPGLFPVGDTLVTYVATDASGNNASCVIKVTVREHRCTQPPAPANGNADCQSTTSGVTCIISCLEGYDLEPDSPSEFSCTFVEGWTPYRPESFPDCSESVQSTAATVKARMLYSAPLGLECDETTQMNMRDHIHTKLATQATMCPEGVSCAVEDLHVDCSMVDATPSGRRYKRSKETEIGVSFRITGLHNERTSSPSSDKHILSAMKAFLANLKEAVLRKELDVTLDEGDLTATALEESEDEARLVCPPGSIPSLSHCVKCPVGTYFDSYNKTQAKCRPCPKGTFQTDEGQEICVRCPNRTSTVAARSKSEHECKEQCRPGTFSETGLRPCKRCRKCHYQPDYGTASCTPCPSGTRSKRRGSVSVKECEALCSPGFVSKSGVVPCFKCPNGYYQPKQGQKACRRCPDGAGDAATAQDKAVSGRCNGSVPSTERVDLREFAEASPCLSQPCLNGATCFAVPAGFLCVCQPLFAGPRCERRRNQCTRNPCRFGAKCSEEPGGFSCHCPAGRTGTDCSEDVEECASTPCLNNGTCVNTLGSFSCSCKQGFGGQTCALDEDECLSAPCLNGGTCLDQPGNFSCLCPALFGGRWCEEELDACASGPCLNGAKCVNLGSRYRCVCSAGYDGEHCDIDIDECSAAPCNEGSTCLDLVGRFECSCPPGLTGRLCESEADPRFKLYFSGTNVFDRASVESLRKPLKELTACMWMKTTDRYNYGTPFSYATDGVDNMLTFTDYSGFVLYVNGHRTITDVTANDGYWHHVCFSWSSAEGLWSVVKDGRLAESGAGLAAGTEIPANGTLVLGQEQDRRGGSFSISESYSGEMTQVNVWSAVLSVDEVAPLLTRCQFYFGDVVAWTDFKERLRGHISAVSWGFCQGCPPPPAPIHGLVSFSTTSTASVATYSCDQGHDVQRATTRRCLASGEWSHPIPVCIGVPCEIPAEPVNGSVRGTGFRYSAKVTYVCSRGYRILGSADRRCQEDGRWSGQEPQCESITCETHPQVTNGVLAPFNESQFRPGSKLRVICEKGYEFRERELVCTEHGEWSPLNAICQPISCQEPLTVANGVAGLVSEMDGARVVVTVTYSCREGFVLRGSQTLTCDVEVGTWSHDPPTCERLSCGQLTNLPAGVLCEAGDRHFFGDVVSCHCDLGYKISGRMEIVCLANKTWSSLEATCTPMKCPTPANPQHGEVTAASLEFGAMANYLCHPNYTLLGTRWRRCSYDGSWSDHEPTCVPLECPPHLPVANGRVTGSGRTLGSTVSVTCSRGFELRGASARICHNAALWSPPKTPLCEPAHCSEPIVGPHAALSYTDTALGSTARFSCADGYVLVGNEAAVCGWGGLWAPSVPDCIPVDCGPPPPLEHGQAVESESTKFQSVAKYSCRAGFRLLGSGQRTCTANGTWNGDIVCDVVSCPEPEEVPHGTAVYPSTTYGSSVEYQCDPWFQLHGVQQRTCLADGTWSDSAPQCQPTSCTVPRPIKHGRVHTTQSFSLFACERGFRLVGPKALRCRADGTWSGELPECVPMNCSLHGQVPNGRLVQDDATGETVRASCDPRYRLQGVDRWTCLADGSWMVPGETTCLLAECPPPDPPVNGVVSGTDFNISSVVFYHCNPGYILDGLRQRTCLDTGQWESDVPTCNPVQGCGTAVRPCPDSSCPEPRQPLNGHVTYDRLTVGGIANYTCQPGYRLSGPTSRLCGRDGRWEGREPSCRARRCPPLQVTPEHARVDYTGFTQGHNATFSCDKGYSARGLSRSVCQSDGSWKREGIFECLRDHCPPLQSPARGRLILEGAWLGAKAHYECDAGHNIFGGASRVCEPDGTWSGTEASCV
ncbi:sushi, von Willebrand factor type A, EGF and pentraxin domain-containing protein 1-like [Dermacentor albipictus]|uniref:sushi, von Willebrand factor type A, EGF and pentraxin domain-containing protein 1-like n=1 Tax=Dermacentor albipictus TaxID=60249 RepID=UPI0031FC8084